MMMRFRLPYSAAIVPSVTLAVTLALGGAGCDSQTTRTDTTTAVEPLLQIRTVSNRADLVSGGDAMVQITLPPDTAPDGLHVTVGARDVTSEFAVRSDGRILGVIRGLAEGLNKVSVDLGGKNGASLPITNRTNGPIFSGPRVTPFECATPTPRAESGDKPRANASGLTSVAAAGDADCTLKTEVKLFYRSTDPTCVNAEPDPSPGDPPLPPNPCFKPYDPNAPAPADLKMTTTDAGVTVPYIVRDERGTLNRGIYDIVVLFDPKADAKDAGWKPFAPQRAWNGKVLYSFGASSNQPRLQFRSEQHWNNEDVALSRGYMVAFNSMTDSLYNSNRTLMTETLMMMKEKIVDNYGEIKYMVGNGCSGGSINQLTASSIFPGLLDGIQPACTYPDSETTAMEVVDCLQLVRAFSSQAWLQLMTDQGVAAPDVLAKRAAIAGHVDFMGCVAWVNSFADGGKPGHFRPTRVDPATGLMIVPSPAAPRNNCLLPEVLVYNKDTRPDGVRCGAADNAAAIYGFRTDEDGEVLEPKRARTTNDNVGVQYGLKALLDGDINGAEFLVVNEQAGGLDADADLTDARTQADPEALEIAYRAGIVSDGAHLAQVPILDLRGYDESGIHHSWRSYELRARLDDANGNHDNHVMWRQGLALALPSSFPLPSEALAVMDKWITAIKADDSGDPIADVIVASKPEDAVDLCYLSTDTTLSTKVFDMKVCDADARLVPHSSPRQVAGGPVAENILKCQLKPVDPADYDGKLTEAQITRLKELFEDGVCDFSKPGVGQAPAESPLDFSSGPGGIPFRNPPSTKGP
jgi:hypothetical protein